MLDALNEIVEDRARFPIEPRYLLKETPNPIKEEAYKGGRNKVKDWSAFKDESRGVLKTVKKHPKVKDVLIGTFKTESWMEPMVTCKKTNKIYRIDSTGTVIYRENCRPAGKQKQTFTPRPTYFYKPMASGIKPNAFVRMHVPPGSDHGAKNQHRSCWVIEAYTNKQRTKLVNIYGFKP